MRFSIKQLLVFLGVFVLLVSIPITVYLVKQRQELKSKAEEVKVQTGQEIEAVDSPYGVHGGPTMLGSNVAYKTHLAQNLYGAGVKWTRQNFGWNSLEYTKGVWGWNDLDAAIQISVNSGLNILPVLLSTPRWASSCPWPDEPPPSSSCDNKFWRWRPKTENWDDWENYVRQVVKRYGAPSARNPDAKNQIHYWEIWNEQDAIGFWRVPVPQGVDPNAPDFRGDGYFELLTRAARAIKEEDPQAKVVFGGLTPSGINNTCPSCGTRQVIERLLNKPDIGDYFDIFNIHVYGNMGGATETVNNAKQLLQQYRLTDKPIWVTETNPGPNGDLPAQAGQLASWYSDLIRAGVEKVFWFYTVNWCWTPAQSGGFLCDPPNDAFKAGGLLKTNFSPQPEIYNVYKNMAVNYTPPGQPTLISPANNSQTTNPRPTFTWNVASPGSNPLASYMIQIDQVCATCNPIFTSPDFFESTTAVEFTPPTNLSHAINFAPYPMSNEIPINLPENNPNIYSHTRLLNEGYQIFNPPAGGNQQVWFTPNLASIDMLNLFTQPELWSQARSKINVFKFYSQQLSRAQCPRCGPNTLSNLVQVGAFSKLTNWGIDIAMEAGVIKEGRCDPNEFINITKSALRNVASNSGTVRYIAMDEPTIGGNGSALPCGLTMEQIADKTAQYINGVKAEFPNVLIGDIEGYRPGQGGPPWGTVDFLERWIDALIARNAKPAFLHMDIAGFWSSFPNMQADMRRLKTFAESRGIPFGIIINEAAAPVSDKEYYQLAMDRLIAQKAMIGVPSQILFQSWSPSTGIYYWRVKAKDNQGNFGKWSETWKLTIILLVGDIDQDGDVDIYDYNLLVQDFGPRMPPGSPADLDHDGDVDIYDYNLLVTNFGRRI